ncbi:hypothetical protein [Uliginosibacterium sp. H1]|uniref:hypothetical protein n=1 Tax=Uliginosibacterium sp. H1 TaxID=3114757 RepID=UPI002E172FF4|nr:hypothetical protein [Uliginosibacterium sp. H1]
MTKIRRVLAAVALACPVTALANADPTGVGELILWAVIVAFGLWVLVAFGGALVMTKSWPISLILGAVIAAAPLAYLGIKDYQYRKHNDDLAHLNKLLSDATEAYLLDVCKQERRLISHRRVDPSGGVLVNISPASTPDRGLLSWDRQMHPASILAASRFLYVEDVAKSSSKVVARKQWWLGDGHRHAKDPAELDRRLETLQDSENHWLSQRTISSIAKYEVSVADVSTSTDRSNWVARGHIKLTHRETGEVVAEYVGFAANKAPAYGGQHGKHSWENASVCPGPERKYERAPYWDVVGFFFQEVVQYENPSK